VLFQLTTSFGSSGITVGTGVYQLTLPVAANLANQRLLGYAIKNSGTVRYEINGLTQASSTTVTLLSQLASPTLGQVTNTSPTVPFTFGVNDTFILSGIYESV
jgi:hypothetical protein